MYILDFDEDGAVIVENVCVYVLVMKMVVVVKGVCSYVDEDDGDGGSGNDDDGGGGV